MNVANNLEHAARYFLDRIAVIDRDREVSYRQFNGEVTRMSSALAACGMGPGDHILLCVPNSYRWFVFYFAVLRLGAVAVTVSPVLTRQELAFVVNDSRPRLVFTDDRKADVFSGFLKDGPVETLVCNSGTLSYERLLEKGSEGFPVAERDRHDTAAVLYTGGVSGLLKGVMLTHLNIHTAAHNVAFCERSGESDRAFCFLPLNHVFGQMHIMHSTVYSGGSLVVQKAFDLTAVVDAVKRYKVSKFYAVPTIYVRLLAIPDLKEKLSSVRYCFSAAARMDGEIVREWKGRTGLVIHEAYGLTETASLVTYNHYHRHVIGSVGTPANLVEVQIRDPRGNVLERGDEGEICIRGPNIMKGYLNQPRETASAFWGEWFRSGDIGILDGEGYLYILDRLKDMIITGGENVYPREVEEALSGCPQIRECAVIGLPHREYGERVAAVIVPTDGCHPDVQALKSYLKERLAPFKVPKEFITVPELPKGPSGKILKRELKKRYAA